MLLRECFEKKTILAMVGVGKSGLRWAVVISLCLASHGCGWGAADPSFSGSGPPSVVTDVDGVMAVDGGVARALPTPYCGWREGRVLEHTRFAGEILAGDGAVDVLGRGVRFSGSFQRDCVAHGYRLVAPMEATFEVSLRVTSSTVKEVVVSLMGTEAVERVRSGQGPTSEAPLFQLRHAASEAKTARGLFSTQRPGEHLLLVHGEREALDGTYDLEVRCVSGCERKATGYPIILVHGMSGWDTALGVLDYFHRVRPTLVEAGYEVFTPQLSPNNNSAIRGSELADYVDQVLQSTGAKRVNLIAHSQGGLDVRFMISTLGYGGRVGAAITVASPHRGSPVTRLFTDDIPGGEVLAEAVLGLWSLILGRPESEARESLMQLSTENMARFNQANLDDPRVQYWSFGGISCGASDDVCKAAHQGEVIDPLLSISFNYLRDAGYSDNDGLVSHDSAVWGDFLGDLPADHFDQIGQIADGGDGAFDHIAFYESLAARLHDHGF